MKHKQIVSTIVGALLLMLASVLFPAPASMLGISTTSIDKLAANDSCGVPTTLIKCSGSGDNEIVKAFVEIFNFASIGVGILVVAGIIFGGLRYATANGNSSQASQGMTYIVNSIIGLLVFIFMFAIVNWLVPGGLFSGSASNSNQNQQNNNNSGDNDGSNNNSGGDDNGSGDGSGELDGTGRPLIDERSQNPSSNDQKPRELDGTGRPLVDESSQNPYGNDQPLGNLNAG